MKLSFSSVFVHTLSLIYEKRMCMKCSATTVLCMLNGISVSYWSSSTNVISYSVRGVNHYLKWRTRFLISVISRKMLWFLWFLWFPLISNDFLGFVTISRDFPWFPRFPLISRDFDDFCDFCDYNWFTMISCDLQWFHLISHDFCDFRWFLVISLISHDVSDSL